MKSLVVALGGAAVGAAVCLGPQGRRPPGGVKVARVATLEELPADGVPRSFPVYATGLEVWNKLFGKPVGAVFLRRMGVDSLVAFNAACPHAGCRVDFEPDRKGYLCPCHKSSFTIEGKLADPSSQALRGLDELKVELRDGREIWVHFQDFHPGHAEKYPI
ncbi:MAG: Rieske (2Fe-2S) protein [Verrucomicrobia bacterium]|nr:Rieske (2Fe-2S) protein [Verrucomicrobiota bacterium]